MLYVYETSFETFRCKMDVSDFLCAKQSKQRGMVGHDHNAIFTVYLILFSIHLRYSSVPVIDKEVGYYLEIHLYM